MLPSFFIYCSDTDAWKAGKHIFRQISTTLCTLAVSSAQPLLWSRRSSWKPSFAIKSFERSRQCFLPQPLFDSTNNCFISQSAPQIHALTQIWSSSSCLVSFHPIQRFRTPPPRFCKCFIFYSSLVTTMWLWVIPISLLLVYPANLSQRLWWSLLENWYSLSWPVFIFC